MIYSQSPKLTGYHGTYPENVESIKENNFNESDALTWLGKGVYFFIDGINTDPCHEYARLWAIDRCWDNDKKIFRNKEFSVLEAIIRINDNKMLNLTIPQGKKLFNEYRKRSLEKINESGKGILGRFVDSDILDEMRKDLGIDFVLSDLYIRFAIQRKERLESKVPNVTVLVVRNPSTHIHRKTIKEILKGEIK